MSSQKEVELKGGLYTFMSLKLRTTDLDVINAELASKVQQAPGFFKDTPVVVDISFIDAIDDQSSTLSGADLLKCIKNNNFLPVVASVSNKSSPLATSIELPLIEGGQQRERNAASAKVTASSGDKPAEAAAKDVANAVPDVELVQGPSEVEYIAKNSMLVKRTIRSGQQVYARDTDLTVMGSVGAGAEVIADGNIHVYGPLRGKALCGVSGNSDARIFCQSLEAELVSVAGNYRLLEEIPEDLRGKPAQIWWEKDRLNIEPL